MAAVREAPSKREALDKESRLLMPTTDPTFNNWVVTFDETILGEWTDIRLIKTLIAYNTVISLTW